MVTVEVDYWFAVAGEGLKIHSGRFAVVVAVGQGLQTDHLVGVEWEVGQGLCWG